MGDTNAHMQGLFNGGMGVCHMNIPFTDLTAFSLSRTLTTMSAMEK